MSKRKKKMPALLAGNNDTQSSGHHYAMADYLHLEQSLYRRELDDWLLARQARVNISHPITYYLQQLYADALLDNHLLGAIEKQRILPQLSKEFIIRDSNDATVPKLSRLLQGKWFRDILREALWSIFRGYSLLFVDDLAAPERTVMPLHRENVIPELGIFARNPLNPEAEHIAYDEYPNHFLFASLGNDLIGDLVSVAPLTIYKRHSWASWDEFEQIFGLPLRIARTAINTKEHLDDIQQWLETMGTASYGIFPSTTSLEIHESQHKDAYHIYAEKISMANAEISKRILGQTMTMDDGSSQSQAEVHLKILQQVQDADTVELQEWVNTTLLPVLRHHGLPIPDDHYFAMQAKEVVSPKDKITIDQVLLNAGYNLDTNYIEEFYGTPLDPKEPRRDPGLAALSAPDYSPFV